MLQFSSPIWLYAIAGILIPLTIHLFSSRPPRIIKIGTVDLLKVNLVSKSRTRRLSDYLLLLIRCLLLILLAFLFARPRFEWLANNKTEKGWLLLAARDFGRAKSVYGKEIDSLIQSGYSLHVLAPGFEKIEDSSRFPSSGNDILYWRLFEMADRQADPKTAFYIISSARHSGFEGARPLTQRDVKWKVFASESILNWTQAAYETKKDSVQLIRGQASPAAIRYYHSKRAPGSAIPPDYVTDQYGYKKIQPDGHSFTGIDTASLRIALFADRKYAADLAYLSAAINAIQLYTGRKIVIEVIDGSTKTEQQDWLFWLSDQPFPAHSNTANLFFYATGKPFQTNSVAYTSCVKYLPVHFSLYNLLPAYNTDSAGNIIWQESGGGPLLDEYSKNGSTYYRFYSHFDPAWNQLVWDASFPAFLMQLLLGTHQTRARALDFIDLDSNQVVPFRAAESSREIKKPPVLVQKKDLKQFVWLLIFILFVLERAITFSKRNLAGRVLA